LKGHFSSPKTNGKDIQCPICNGPKCRGRSALVVGIVFAEVGSETVSVCVIVIGIRGYPKTFWHGVRLSKLWIDTLFNAIPSVTILSTCMKASVSVNLSFIKSSQTLVKYRASNDNGASQAVTIIVLNSEHFRNRGRCMNYFIKLWFRRMPIYPKTEVLIAKWSIMTLRINFMHNGSEIDLHVSQQTIVFSFRLPGITCCNPRTRCNPRLWYLKAFKRNKVDWRERRNLRNGWSRSFWSSNLDGAWATAILVSARLSEANVHSTIHSSLVIDKLSRLCREASSLDRPQTERGTKRDKRSNLRQPLENDMFGWGSWLTVSLDPSWIMALFFNSSQNYLVAGRRITSRKRKAHDSGQKGWSQSHGIFTGCTLPKSFQKDKHLMLSITSISMQSPFLIANVVWRISWRILTPIPMPY
jgi:hypothetical protein